MNDINKGGVYEILKGKATPKEIEDVYCTIHNTKNYDGLTIFEIGKQISQSILKTLIVEIVGALESCGLIRKMTVGNGAYVYVSTSSSEVSDNVVERIIEKGRPSKMVEKEILSIYKYFIDNKETHIASCRQIMEKSKTTATLSKVSVILHQFAEVGIIDRHKAKKTLPYQYTFKNHSHVLDEKLGIKPIEAEKKTEEVLEVKNDELKPIEEIMVLAENLKDTLAKMEGSARKAIADQKVLEEGSVDNAFKNLMDIITAPQNKHLIISMINVSNGAHSLEEKTEIIALVENWVEDKRPKF